MKKMKFYTITIIHMIKRHNHKWKYSFKHDIEAFNL